MKRLINAIFLLPLLILPACSGEKPVELYHTFPGNQWPRFNKLSFEIPVEKANQRVDLIFFARLTADFQYETLDFNMVLKAAGEERINEYQMKVNSENDSDKNPPANGIHEVSCLLKKQFNTGKPGTVFIEIESLTPRLATEGIVGAGIRMVPSGK